MAAILGALRSLARLRLHSTGLKSAQTHCGFLGEEGEFYFRDHVQVLQWIIVGLGGACFEDWHDR